jgi:hypothetical protein
MQCQQVLEFEEAQKERLEDVKKQTDQVHELFTAIKAKEEEVVEKQRQLNAMNVTINKLKETIQQVRVCVCLCVWCMHTWSV